MLPEAVCYAKSKYWGPASLEILEFSCLKVKMTGSWAEDHHFTFAAGIEKKKAGRVKSFSKFHTGTLEQWNERGKKKSTREYSHQIEIHQAIVTVLIYCIYNNKANSSRAESMNVMMWAKSILKANVFIWKIELNRPHLLVTQNTMSCHSFTALWTSGAAVRWWISVCTKHWLFLTNLCNPEWCWSQNHPEWQKVNTETERGLS